MRDIRIIPGYYEWSLYVNGENLFSFGDLGETADIYQNKDDFAEALFDSLLDALDEKYEKEEIMELSNALKGLTVEEYAEMKEQMRNIWTYYHTELLL